MVKIEWYTARPPEKMNTNFVCECVFGNVNWAQKRRGAATAQLLYFCFSSEMSGMDSTTAPGKLTEAHKKHLTLTREVFLYFEFFDFFKAPNS